MTSPKLSAIEERRIIKACERVRVTEDAHTEALDMRSTLLRNLRGQGWTVAALASLAGVSHQRMSKICDGNRAPQPRTPSA